MYSLDNFGCRNCLFRALGDQLDGTTTTHHKHRHLVVDYMRQHREDFEPFVEDDVPFERHCESVDLSSVLSDTCVTAGLLLSHIMIVPVLFIPVCLSVYMYLIVVNRA